MEDLDPAAEMARWSRPSRWWASSGAQDRIDIAIPRGVWTPSRRTRTVLLRDATDPGRYLRPSRRNSSGFNTSGHVLLSANRTSARELEHLCWHGWGLEFWGPLVTRHRRFQRSMLVAVGLHHLAQWGRLPEEDVYETHLPEGSRERSVLTHLEACSPSGFLWRTGRSEEEERTEARTLLALGKRLLTLNDDGWEVYTQLAEDDRTSTSSWERLTELAEAAEALTSEPTRPEEVSWTDPLTLGW